MFKCSIVFIYVTLQDQVNLMITCQWMLKRVDLMRPSSVVCQAILLHLFQHFSNQLRRHTKP